MSRADRADWARLRAALWPESGAGEHESEIAALLQAPGATLNLIARDLRGKALGFAEAGLRHDYVNGCKTSPVAFLEGIYVRPEARRKGVAGALVAAVEDWARQQGCREFASDALADNIDSRAMHAALGFTETQRVVFFRKTLG